MPQSLANVLIHLVYSTKHRQPWLKDEFREDLHAVKGQTLIDLDCQPIKIGSVEDHAHILFAISRNYPIKAIVQALKTESTKWLKRHDQSLQEFHWQAGYGAFSVSTSNRDQVSGYIERQKEHHRQMSYQDEFRQICRKHGIDIDERYVWD